MRSEASVQYLDGTAPTTAEDATSTRGEGIPGSSSSEKEPLLLHLHARGGDRRLGGGTDEHKRSSEFTIGRLHIKGIWLSVLQLAVTFVAGILATLAWPHLNSTSHASITALSLSSPARPHAVSSLGRTVQLAGVYYFVPGKPKASFQISQTPSEWTESTLLPLMVVPSDERTFDQISLATAAAKYAAEDDVWTAAFMENVLLSHTGQPGSAAFVHPQLAAGDNLTIITQGYRSTRRHRHASVIRAEIATASDGTPLPAGPYFASASSGIMSVYEAWRLYSDSERAFYYGTVPHSEDENAFQILSATLPDANGVAAIGVPSRLYYTKSAEKPLAGVRVAVKDLYNIKGLKTSMGSRAWLSLYPPASSTAPCIQRLIDLGAVIVGKTRLSQFANGQYGTADSVDYGVPFNPRGDGYQDPSSSSSGAGAAAGAYSFIDMSVGSDTGGSVRAPAGVNGAFGNRPSLGAIDLHGTLPVSHELDTSAFLTMDAHKFAEYGKAYYGGNSTFRSYPSFPKKLLYLVDPETPGDKGLPSPGFFPSKNSAAAPLYESFVRHLEAFLGVERTRVDFYAAFRDRFGMLPADYIGPAWSLLTAYDQWNLVGRHFTEDYKFANNGDTPPVDPPVRFNWDYAANNITASQREFYVERKATFKRFIEEELMNRNSSETCSNALTVFPLSTGLPAYKSDYHDAPSTVYKGWNRFSISQLGQVPEVVIPIGQVSYVSKITKTTKYLPVSISIQAAAGCDFILYDLVAALADRGIIRNPTPGTSDTFPPRTEI